MRNHKKEYEIEKLKFGRFQTKLKKEDLEKFEGISKADFLRWCISEGIIDLFKKSEK